MLRLGVPPRDTRKLPALAAAVSSAMPFNENLRAMFYKHLGRRRSAYLSLYLKKWTVLF